MARLIARPELCIYVVAAALECRSARRADIPHLFSATPFDAPAKPAVSILEYVTRIAEGAKASTCVFVTALLYMQLLAESAVEFAPSALNVHRLFITAVTLAVKWHDDIFYSNAYYAALGGISGVELNRLELAFLSAIDFRCSATLEDVEYAECFIIAEACEACVGPAIVPELERAGLWIPHVGRLLQSAVCHAFPSNILPCSVALPAALPQAVAPALPCPILTNPLPSHVDQIAAHHPLPMSTSSVSPAVSTASSVTSSSSTQASSNPGFDAFPGVFLAPSTEQASFEQEEEAYECHAVRMLDIEYGSVVGASV